MTHRSAAREDSGATRTNRVVIGLTGPIASGKSTIADMLRKRGATVIDADHVYRSLLAPGSDLWQRVVARFGSEVAGAGEEIDRTALGRIVFGDPAALADLEEITHPAVVAEIRRQIARSKARVIVVEAIKLAQSGLLADINRLWIVTADPVTRTERLMARTGFDKELARLRIAASPALPAGVFADVVIENAGELSAACRAVETAWRSLETGSPCENRAAVFASAGSEYSDTVKLADQGSNDLASRSIVAASPDG